MMSVPGILIAAPSSGSGKTSIACGLMAALKKRGKKVRSCKCGPDYIDPMFHQEVLGISSENLDLFFSDPSQLRQNYENHCKDGDFVVTEGVMGYYDGMRMDSWKASSYDVAVKLQLPVILVVSCKGAALSICALIRGMVEFQKESHIEGILLNRVSQMMYPRYKQMIETQLEEMGHRIPVVGYVPEDDAFHLESRHLGLVTPQEIAHLKKQLDEASSILDQTVDLDLIEKIAELACTKGEQKKETDREFQIVDRQEGKKLRIGVARDKAFCFYYKDNLELLEQLGAELVYFSPIEDQQLPERLSGLLLGGGYPELYCRPLSENKSMRQEIRNAINQGMPCLAECGGFMYLHEEMSDSSNRLWPMAGVLEGMSFPTGKLGHFGYISLRMNEENFESGQDKLLYLKAGESIRGHEFHYWDSTDSGTDCVAEKPDGKRRWACIRTKNHLFAGYPHLYYPSLPIFAERFLKKCELWEKEK